MDQPPAQSLITPPLPKLFVLPTLGLVITSALTKNSFTIGEKIGEGNFGMVYSCQDVWRNDLAVKVLKPTGSYEQVQKAAQSEFIKLLQLRNPYITFVYDAFEYRDTFYIITERCHGNLSGIFTIPNFDGKLWILPVARCLLQAVHYLHINQHVHQDIHLGNVFTTFVKDEMVTGINNTALKFKLGDLGVAKLFSEVDATNTRNQGILPPEVYNTSEFGAVDYRIDIYHLGLLFLQLAYSKEIQFTREEVLVGKPREMAASLPPPLNFALEKALRRHVQFRTADVMELWRDLNSSPQLPNLPPLIETSKP
ncbi:MAG TPA: protein kinase family protein [Verrucomicrobiae bacterium]